MAAEKAKNPPWGFISKAVGRLVALGLVAFFVSKVIIAVGKLQNEKTGLSVTSHFERSRLMPSISICFRKKIWHYEYPNCQCHYNATTMSYKCHYPRCQENGTGVELGLNVSRQVTS